MKKWATPFVLIICLTLGAFALGGGGGGEDPGDDTLKISLKPLEEGSKIYGWVRIKTDEFSLGANRLQKDEWYAVYLVAGDEKKALSEEPARRASGSGELKYGARLEEPLGGQWEKIVVFHQPGGEKDDSKLEPVLEGSLR